MQNKFLQQLQQLWARLNGRQRLIVGGGTAATLVALLWLTHAFATPEYKPLMVGLEPDDAQAISAQLAAKKIGFQMTPDGKGINVAADQLDAARMEVASQGAPHSGRMGFELFDKTSWGQTEFDEKVNYQRAMEGELERTIATLKGVKSARVHLVMPHSSVFLDRERGAKASVTLRMKRGALTEDQLEAIARLVSGAVDDLKPSDVAIVDADSNESLGHRAGTAAGREIEAELSKRLLATLGPAVGTENLRASVNVEYDLSTSEESQDKYDPAVSAVLQSQKTSEQTGTGSAATGGVAGTGSNLPGLTPMGQKVAAAGQLPGQAQGTTNQPAASQDANAGGDDSSQVSTSENAVFGVNKIVRHTVSPAGRIRRITAAILINDVQDRKLVKGQWVVSSRKRAPEQLEKLGDLAKAVLGADPQRGDVVSVQNLTFDDPSAMEPPPSALERVREGLHDYSGVVRYGGLLALFGLVWALMFRPVQKQVVTTIKELAAGATGAPQLATAGAPGALGAGAAATGLTAGGSLTPEKDVNVVRRNLAELVQAEPVAMTRTLQAWMREDGA